MIGIVLITILVIGYFLILNSKVKNKGATLIEKTVTAILSTLVLSLYLAFIGYTPVEEKQAGIGYNSFEGLFIVFLMYSLPVFLICGSLYSFFVDIYLDNIHFRTALLKYIFGFLVYLAGGLFIVGLFFTIIFLIEGSLNGLLISAIFKGAILPSLLFYHISLFSKKVLKFTSR